MQSGGVVAYSFVKQTVTHSFLQQRRFQPFGGQWGRPQAPHKMLLLFQNLSHKHERFRGVHTYCASTLSGQMLDGLQRTRMRGRF